MLEFLYHRDKACWFRILASNEITHPGSEKANRLRQSSIDQKSSSTSFNSSSSNDECHSLVSATGYRQITCLHGGRCPVVSTVIAARAQRSFSVGKQGLRTNKYQVTSIDLISTGPTM